MRHYFETAFQRQVANSTCFCQAAHAPYIGLDDRYLAAIHQVEKFETSAQPFAGGNRYRLLCRKARVPFKIVRRQRRFDKVEIEWFPLPNRGQTSDRVRKRVLHIDHQDEGRTDSFAYCGDRFCHASMRSP